MSTKTIKKEVKQKTEKTEDIDSNEEMETHSIWYGRLKTNPIEAKFFKEFLIDFKVGFKLDESEYESILNHYWGKSIEDLEKLIKTQNKREKKVKETFKPEGLKKPKSAYNLYCKYYATECKSKEIKFELKNASSTWNELSDVKKQKYINDALTQKNDYNSQYENLKADAIKNGDISAVKPKSPVTAYFRYLNDKRSEIKDKLMKKGDGETEKLNIKIVTEAGKMWRELSDEDKEPYETIYQEEKEKYNVELEKWKVIETSRLKKLAGEDEDIKIDESIGKTDDNKSNQEQDLEIDEETIIEETTTKKSSKKEHKETKESKESKTPKTPKTKKEKKVTLTDEEDA
jgi:hypothetical protein